MNKYTKIISDNAKQLNFSKSNSLYTKILNEYIGKNCSIRFDSDSLYINGILYEDAKQGSKNIYKIKKYDFGSDQIYSIEIFPDRINITLK